MIINRASMFLKRIAHTLIPLEDNKEEMAARLQIWPPSMRIQIFITMQQEKSELKANGKSATKHTRK